MKENVAPGYDVRTGPRLNGDCLRQNPGMKDDAHDAPVSARHRPQPPFP
ncbi:hypothetical protein [Burkholderia lata]|nr:hypothetical protein [Burkholderia lata]